MNHEQFEQLAQDLTERVHQTIKVEVNGKVETLSMELKEYIKKDELWKEKDQTWKDNAQPAIDAFVNIRGGYKTIILLAGLIAAVGAAVVYLKKLLT